MRPRTPQTLSEWFRSLTPKERKRLVGSLYTLRYLNQVQGGSDWENLKDLVEVLDDEYHRLKQD